MNIAFISYEYPPDTAYGGISTYVDQISRVLRDKGHTVHVFCGSPMRNIDEIIDGIHIHRIMTLDTFKFKELIVDKFTNVHQQERIEIIESPEYNADGLIIKKTFPEIPLVVRLHTPTFLIREIIWSQTPLKYKLKKYLSDSFGIYKKNKPTINHESDLEKNICQIADLIHSPSESLAEICIKKWSLDMTKVKVIPNVFEPSEKLLNIPIRSNPGQNIYYFGRLEIRKGIYIFEKVIPLVLEKYPKAEFYFIGKNKKCFSEETFKDYLIRKCKKYNQKLHFKQVKYDEIPEEMENADICVFPSVWENFPNVCLEAMSAGKAIIASKNGGMKDMLFDNSAGLLIDPLDYNQISQCIINLFDKPALIEEYGIRARLSVIKKYNKEKIGKKVEDEFFKFSSFENLKKTN
jgi:glycosyltransferase involved in cell wall biosynthesis